MRAWKIDSIKQLKLDLQVELGFLVGNQGRTFRCNQVALLRKRIGNLKRIINPSNT